MGLTKHPFAITLIKHLGIIQSPAILRKTDYKKSNKTAKVLLAHFN
jgi:hypothetical protein